MRDEHIHIPARQKKLAEDSRPVIRVSREAYSALAEIYNESTLSLAQIASLLILYAAERVVYDKE